MEKVGGGGRSGLDGAKDILAGLRRTSHQVSPDIL